MRLEDIEGLQREKAFDKGSHASRALNLEENGATDAEIEFLLDNRVELNAMTSDQLVTFVERKLKLYGIKKIVPGQDKLEKAYRLFARGHAAEKIVRRELKKFNGDAAVEVPQDIETQVRQHLARRPKDRWDAAVQRIATRLRHEC